MAKFHNGFENIKVTLLDWPANDYAKKVYQFGRLSHDSYIPLQEDYDEHSEDCKWLINKIIEGTTLPKYALQGCNITFRIENISRICLAQLTRDPAIFASASTGVFPLTQDFNIPMSIYNDKSIMDKLQKAQAILEDAYIEACEKEIPSIEARYIGLHCQTISLSASYTISNFARACYSRTSSNFCDECNYVYRLMYNEIIKAIQGIDDQLSIKLYKWHLNDDRCINDEFYERERLYNSDFTCSDYEPKLPALNDWRNSGWKIELERMLETGNNYLTNREKEIISKWKGKSKEELFTTYDNRKPDVCKNMITTMNYYKENKNEQ